jgi:hypothetical protein
MNERHIIHGVGVATYGDKPLKTRLKLAWQILRGRYVGTVDQDKSHVFVSANGPHVVRVAPSGGLPEGSSLHAYNSALVSLVVPGELTTIRDHLTIPKTFDFKKNANPLAPG